MNTTQRWMELTLDRIMSYRCLSRSTKKWTMWMLMQFTDLANSWLLYCEGLTDYGTPNNIMEFRKFCMEVAMTFLAQHNNDNSEFSEDNKPIQWSLCFTSQSAGEVIHFWQTWCHWRMQRRAEQKAAEGKPECSVWHARCSSVYRQIVTDTQPFINSCNDFVFYNFCVDNKRFSHK